MGQILLWVPFSFLSCLQTFLLALSFGILSPLVLTYGRFQCMNLFFSLFTPLHHTFYFTLGKKKLHGRFQNSVLFWSSQVTLFYLVFLHACHHAILADKNYRGREIYVYYNFSDNQVYLIITCF